MIDQRNRVFSFHREQDVIAVAALVRALITTVDPTSRQQARRARVRPQPK
jgi:cobalamin biosynthesis protein CobT